ncbi:MAG: YXWGXW repeat-containing protein [Candidatus Omnitrophica bacterium]|nr:YXWGXW repeat-containing protein [Candidatus Omnitrophota bacterium]
MKTVVIKSVAAAALAGLLAGCVSPSGYTDYTGSGALVGGVSGATIGALAARENPGAGALIGGLAGLVAGGLIGHSMNQQAEAEREVIPPPVYTPAPQRPPPTIADIEAMSKAGVSDDVIISDINSTHAVYNLDANTIIALKNAGVSEKVINYMINTSSNLTVSQAPPPPPQQTVVVAPGPGYVWVGGEWIWNGAGWTWIAGHWVLPPFSHAVWIGPRWIHAHRGWHRVQGYWR